MEVLGQFTPIIFDLVLLSFQAFQAISSPLKPEAFSLLVFYASSIYTIKPKMYNLMCFLIVLIQHLQLNHSCVFTVVSKVGNRVTIQLTSYAKNPIQRLLMILKFLVNTWIKTTDLVWNSHQSRLLYQVLYFLGIFIRSTCAKMSNDYIQHGYNHPN